MARKTPGFYFYTGDWLKDPALSKCSEATRGIWIDLLCAMHDDARDGSLTGTPDQLARIGRSTASVIVSAIEELASSGAAVIREREGVFSVTCRRLSRESHARKQACLRKQNERVRKKSRLSHSASSISTSHALSSRDNLAVALSPESPPRTGQTAPKDRKGAEKTSERESKSRFSLKECEQYAASLKRINSPKAYGKTIWRSGEDDDAIAAYLAGTSGTPIKKPPDKPVDVAAVQRLAAEFEAMDPPRHDLAEQLRASIEASK